MGGDGINGVWLGGGRVDYFLNVNKRVYGIKTEGRGVGN